MDLLGCFQVNTLRKEPSRNCTTFGRLVVLPLLVLRRLGPAPVKPVLVIVFLENSKEFPEIITMLGANLSDQIPGGPNLTLTLILNSN